MKMYAQGVRPVALAEFAAALHVTVAALKALGVGFDGTNWTTPMRDGAGTVIGVQLRPPVGRKTCVPGSHLGLFVPSTVGRNGHDLLCIVEGASDCAAMLDMGYETVGRPSCSAGVEQLVQWTFDHPYRHIVIVADADEPGIRGARVLAARLHATVVLPPGGAKDVRASTRDKAVWGKLLNT